MSIQHIFQEYCYVVGTSFHFETLYSAQPINLVIEEISRNKPAVQTLITFYKSKSASIRHNSIITLMKSDASFFRMI